MAGNLLISNRAHVLFPVHRMMEKMSEGREGRVSIGTTSRGIGPCYEDKTATPRHPRRRPAGHRVLPRTVRFGDGREGRHRQGFRHLQRARPEAHPGGIRSLRRAHPPDGLRYPALLNKAMRDGKTVLFEGAQGTMLDIDHGHTPS